MNLLEKENIFLLEFLVDRICIDIMGTWDQRVHNAETCVGFTFLNYGPFYVGDDDFVPTKKWVVNGCSGCGNIKNGKSILFSLTPKMVEETRDNFVVYLEIMKRLPEFTPETVTLGNTAVPLMELFQQLLEKVEKGTVPITKTLKETFEIKDKNGEKIGKIGAYVRLSCFGKVIVTKFQMNYEAESVNFSAKEGKCLYKYNKKDNCNNFRTDVCCPGYPCLPCCPAVQAAMKERDRKRSAGGIGGVGGTGGVDGMGNKDGSGPGNGNGGDGGGRGGKGGRGSGGDGSGGKGKYGGGRGGKFGSDSSGSKGSSYSKDSRKKNRPDLPFICGPASTSSNRDFLPACSVPCTPCTPCTPCSPCSPCQKCPPCSRPNCNEQ